MSARKAKPGAPTLYDPAFVDKARNMCRAGATYMELAQEFGVSKRTIINWTQKHPDFRRACKVGGAYADDNVERGLYERAVGYTYEAVEVYVVANKIKRVKVLRHVPPDVTAQAKWLHNRRPMKWRDKHAIEHSGSMSLESLISQSEKKPDEPTGE